MQRQQKLQCKNIVGDIQCVTTTKTTIQGYCGRYSGCNDNRNYNARDIQGATTTETTMQGYCGRYSGCNDNRNYNAGDIQGATTTETTLQGHCEKNQGATTTETTIQGYCGRYSGCKDSRNYNAELLWEIFRVQRQQKLQCRAIAGDIQGATATKITMQGYWRRYSGCSDNRNYNVGLS